MHHYTLWPLIVKFKFTQLNGQTYIVPSTVYHGLWDPCSYINFIRDNFHPSLCRESTGKISACMYHN